MRGPMIAAMAASMLTGGAQAANLVTNGGFEMKSPGTPASFEVGPSYIYGDAVTGWTSGNANAFNLLFDSATATSVDAQTRFTSSEPQRLSFENYGGASPDGGNFMALDGDTNFNGTFNQTITGLTSGKTYRLKFYWAATQYSNRTGATTERLDVTFGGNGFSTATVANPTHGFQGWFTEDRLVTATGSSQLLSFLSVGTPAGLPPVALLDGVSLTAVPEPATWAMLILGFGLVGVAARRRGVARVSA